VRNEKRKHSGTCEIQKTKNQFKIARKSKINEKGREKHMDLIISCNFLKYVH